MSGAPFSCGVLSACFDSYVAIVSVDTACNGGCGFCCWLHVHLHAAACAWLVFGGLGLLGLWRALRPGPRRGALLRALVPVGHCCCAVFAAAPCGQPTAPPAVLRCACSPSAIQRARRPSSDPHMPPNARRRRTESALPRGPPGPPSPLLLGASCPWPIGKMSYYWAGLSPEGAN